MKATEEEGYGTEKALLRRLLHHRLKRLLRSDAERNLTDADEDGADALAQGRVNVPYEGVGDEGVEAGKLSLEL